MLEALFFKSETRVPTVTNYTCYTRCPSQHSKPRKELKICKNRRKEERKVSFMDGKYDFPQRKPTLIPVLLIRINWRV